MPVDDAVTVLIAQHCSKWPLSISPAIISGIRALKSLVEASGAILKVAEMGFTMASNSWDVYMHKSSLGPHEPPR